MPNDIIWCAMKVPFYEFIKNMSQAPSSSVQVLIREDKLDYLKNPSLDFKKYFFLGFLEGIFNLGIWYRLKGKNIDEVTKKLNQLHLQPPEFRPYMRQHFFPLRNNSFLDAKDDLLSFVFVREPFERLVSSYYDKMDRDWSKPVYDLRWMRDEIIHK